MYRWLKWIVDWKWFAQIYKTILQFNLEGLGGWNLGKIMYLWVHHFAKISATYLALLCQKLKIITIHFQPTFQFSSFVHDPGGPLSRYVLTTYLSSTYLGMHKYQIFFEVVSFIFSTFSYFTFGARYFLSELKILHNMC